MAVLYLFPLLDGNSGSCSLELVFEDFGSSSRHTS